MKMKKIIILGVGVFVLMVSANETPKEVSKQKVVEQKQVNGKVQEKMFLKQEVKSKRQTYPRGNIATH